MGLQNHSTAQRLYRTFPIPLQNIVVSGFGYRTKRHRYNDGFKRFTERYLRNQYRSKEAWDREQVKKLDDLLDVARDTTEYYKDIEKPELSSSKSVTEQVKQLPLLDPGTLKEQPESLISTKHNINDCISMSTSGTTGTPKTTYHTPESQQKYWAAMNLLWHQGGCRYGDRRASFTGNKIVPTGEDTGPYGRFDYVNNRLLLSSYHLGSETVDEYLELLAEFQPNFIDGYPSSIRYCAQRAVETDTDIRIPACFPTAETLREKDREIIEAGFSTKVFNQYGSTEGACLVTECRCGRMHVNPQIGIVEVLDENGEQVSDGEVGELVLTGLNNHAMPLIRYRIGDFARGPPEYVECDCGWTTPILDEIIGRQDEVVVTADGRRIPMLSYNVFKYTENIEESQIVQESVDEFTLKITPDEGYTDEQAEIAVEKLKDRVGNDISVDVEIHQEISRTDAGKFRAVVSEVES